MEKTLISYDPTLISKEPSKLSEFGEFGDVWDAKRLGISPEYASHIACIHSSKYESSKGHSIFFLLFDENLVNNPKLSEDARKDMYMNIRSTIRASVKMAGLHLFNVRHDMVLNALQRNAGLGTEEQQKNESEQMVDQLLLDAHTLGASDIHIACGDNDSYIKLRVDGELQNYHADSNQAKLYNHVSVLYGSLAAEDGSMTGTSFNELKKQDGVIYRTISEMKLGARIASHSTNRQEKNFYMVMRLLGNQNETAQHIPFNQLGFVLNQPQGILKALTGKGITLLIGETNSGKSVTMANMLMEIYQHSQGTRNIMSMENPVEKQIKGVNQFTLIDSGVSDEASMKVTVKDLLSYLVRADPDDIAIGELRDKLTSDAAVQMSLSGHNILSTMHCDSPFDVFERLKGLGADADDLKGTGTLKSVVSQKLFKKLCPHCSIKLDEAENLTRDQMLVVEQLCSIGLSSKLQNIRFRNPNGCEECRGKGIRGRQLVAELVEFTPTIVEKLYQQEKSAAEEVWLRANNYSKIDIALMWMFEGVLDGVVVVEQLGTLTHTYHLRESFGINHPEGIYL